MLESYKENEEKLRCIKLYEKEKNKNSYTHVSADKKLSQEGLNHLQELCLGFNELITEEDGSACIQFSEIAEFLKKYPQNVLVFLQNSPFFTFIDNYISVFFDRFDLLCNLFEIIVDILTECPEYTPCFNSKCLYLNAVELITVEIDTLAYFSLKIVRLILEYGLQKNDEIPNLENLLEKLTVACVTNSTDVSEIIYAIIKNYKYENSDINKFAFIMNTILNENDSKLNIFNDIVIFNSIDYLYDICLGKTVSISPITLNDEELTDILADEGIFDSMFYDINMIDFENSKKNSMVKSKKISEFCRIALKVVIRLEKISLSDQWVIRFYFLKHCIEEEEYSIASQAILYIAKKLMNENEEIYNIIKDEEFIEVVLEIFDADEATFETKISIIKIIHALLKRKIDAELYSILIKMFFLKNALFILEDKTKEKNILIGLEVIFMMFQASQLIGDQSSITTIIEEESYEECIMDLLSNENEEIMHHTYELVELLWPGKLKDIEED